MALVRRTVDAAVRDGSTRLAHNDIRHQVEIEDQRADITLTPSTSVGASITRRPRRSGKSSTAIQRPGSATTTSAFTTPNSMLITSRDEYVDVSAQLTVSGFG